MSTATYLAFWHCMITRFTTLRVQFYTYSSLFKFGSASNPSKKHIFKRAKAREPKLFVMFVPLFILTILCIIFFLVLTNSKKNGAKSSPNKHPPGPKGLPFIGNFHQYKPLATHLYLFELSKIYGPIIYLKLGFIPTIVVSSSKLAKEVLKTQDHIFCGRRPLAAQRKLSYNGLDMAFSTYNGYWRERRKTCNTHLFSSKRVQSFSTIRREEVCRVMDEISSLALASKLVNLNELVLSLVSSIICRIGFGKSFGDGHKSKRASKFHKMLNQSQLMFISLFFSDYFPYMGWFDWITGASRKLERVFKELDEFYQELIDEHLDPNRVKSDREDIIDVMLQLSREGGVGIQLTFDHIKAMLMNIFIAGTETTMATIVWAMTYLMKNPNAMKKVQQELRTLIKEQDGKTFIQEEDLHHLSYLQAVVKETLRIHPVIPLLVPHMTTENCTLEGYQIEAGTLVFVNVWAIGRDPETWKDPDIFLPERFLDSPADFKGQDFELIPFGAGRRICPGLLMGTMMIELALANLLCWFDWELPDGMRREDIDMDVLPGITVVKKNALCLHATNVVTS